MEPINLISNCLTSYATIGDNVTYHIVCTNTSSISFDDIFICSSLDPNLKFIKGSVRINNIEKTCEDILTGISIKKFNIGKKLDIKFDAKVISKEIDTINISTSAECIYKEQNDTKSIILNKNTTIHVYDPSIYIHQSVSKDKVNLNDTITYKVKLVNNGDVVLDKVILKDDICDSIKVLEDTFKVNSKPISSCDLKKGINLGRLDVNDLIEVEYDTKIIGSKITCRLRNEVFATYNYYLDNGCVGTKQSETVSCDIDISLPSFKQICIENNVNLPETKEDMSSIENINTDISIKNYHTIKTPIATSNEGSVLSGYKLIVHGILNQVIRYSAKKPNSPIHSFEHEIPFSTFIILPSDYKLQSNVQIEAKEEYTHFNLVNSRSLFESVNILLIAKTLK